MNRLYGAMAAYAVLALLAFFTLDGKFRLGVWIFVAGLAVKTLIAQKAQELRNTPGNTGAVAEEQSDRNEGNESD